MNRNAQVYNNLERYRENSNQSLASISAETRTNNSPGEDISIAKVTLKNNIILHESELEMLYGNMK